MIPLKTSNFRLIIVLFILTSFLNEVYGVELLGVSAHVDSPCDSSPVIPVPGSHNGDFDTDVRRLLPQLSVQEQREYGKQLKSISEMEPVKGAALLEESSDRQETCVEYADIVGSYIYKSGSQVILGNYTDETTALGTIGEVALGFTGADVLCDIRDLSHDLSHPEWSLTWFGKTALDGIGLLPVVGTLKHTDKVSRLLKKGVKTTYKAAGALHTVTRRSGKAARVTAESSDEVLKQTVKNFDEAGEQAVKSIDTSIRKSGSRAPKKGRPNSIYEQVDETGNVRSRTFYDENGHSFDRQDFDHSHGGMKPHEHSKTFDADGRPITKEDVHDLPSGYDNCPSD